MGFINPYSPHMGEIGTIMADRGDPEREFYLADGRAANSRTASIISLQRLAQLNLHHDCLAFKFPAVTPPSWWLAQLHPLLLCLSSF